MDKLNAAAKPWNSGGGLLLRDDRGGRHIVDNLMVAMEIDDL